MRATPAMVSASGIPMPGPISACPDPVRSHRFSAKSPTSARFMARCQVAMRRAAPTSPE